MATSEEILYELAIVHNEIAEELGLPHGSALEERNELGMRLLGHDFPDYLPREPPYGWPHELEFT